MKLPGRRVRIAAGIVLILAGLFVAYGIGYRAGLNDRGPDRRALMVVRRDKNNPNSSGTSATWFDVRNPNEARRFRVEEERLKASGAEYYIAKGDYEWTLSPERIPGRVNAKR